MGFKINPDNWMSNKDYIRFVIWSLTHDRPAGVYDKYYKSKWHKRLATVKTTDGWIHTLWVRYWQLRCNPLTIGWRCWRRGHDYDKQFISFSRNDNIKYYVTVCRYCGHYRGYSTELLNANV